MRVTATGRKYGSRGQEVAPFLEGRQAAACSMGMESNWLGSETSTANLGQPGVTETGCVELGRKKVEVHRTDMRRHNSTVLWELFLLSEKSVPYALIWLLCNPCLFFPLSCTINRKRTASRSAVGLTGGLCGYPVISHTAVCRSLCSNTERKRSIQ